MAKLSRRMLRAGPIDNSDLHKLAKIAKVNGHKEISGFINSIISDILSSDQTDLKWIAVALTKADFDFAVSRFGPDFEPVLDEIINAALEGFREIK